MAANQDPEILAAAAALAVAARSGTLATVHEGMPNAALVTPGLDMDGAPLLLLSTLSAHTRHLAAHPACALLLAGTTGDENAQTTPRLCLSGTAELAPGPEARARYLAVHPYAAQYVDFGDFSIWRIIVTKAHYIGGFASANYLNVAALQHEISRLLARS